MTGPARDGSGLARAIRAAPWTRPGCSHDEIDYVNAHGTGTPYNDAMEAAALRTVFGEGWSARQRFERECWATRWARRGVVETIICVLAMRGSACCPARRACERCGRRHAPSGLFERTASRAKRLAARYETQHGIRRRQRRINLAAWIKFSSPLPVR